MNETITKDLDLLSRWEARMDQVGDSSALMTGWEAGYKEALNECATELRDILEHDVEADDLLPLLEPPKLWKEVGAFGPNGKVYRRRWNGANWTVIRTFGNLQDGQAWCHVSVSRPLRTPTWEEMMEVKKDFLGELEAVQVAPKKHISIHDTCLHWFAPLERWTLPDFTMGGQSI